MTSSLAQIIPTSTAAATQAASRLAQSALAFIAAECGFTMDQVLGHKD